MGLEAVMSSRISSRNRDFTYTHPEAQDYLYHLTVDAKCLFYKTKGENYQPFSMDRLEEWSRHRSDIETCGGFERDMFKYLSNDFVYQHDTEIMAINALVIELKLMVSGYDYKLTEGIVTEASKAFLRISECRKKRVVFYR
jgi:hypothetical protein